MVVDGAGLQAAEETTLATINSAKSLSTPDAANSEKSWQQNKPVVIPAVGLKEPAKNRRFSLSHESELGS